MKKISFVKISTFLAIALTAYFAGFVNSGISASAQPGSPEDPLVSRSYVEGRIAGLESQIAALTALVEAAGNLADLLPPDVPEAPPPAAPAAEVSRELFQVVRTEPGMVLIAGASAEIILRAGEATVVAGPNGLANVTLGTDIMNGQPVHLNHLLIVPQNDGRGLRFHTVSYLMVKGDYQVFYSGAVLPSRLG